MKFFILGVSKMTKQKYQLWLDYRHGKINRELTSEERAEIRDSDFAMFTLIPEPTLDRYHAGHPAVLSQLAKCFKVSNEVMAIRLRLLADRLSKI